MTRPKRITYRPDLPTFGHTQANHGHFTHRAMRSGGELTVMGSRVVRYGVGYTKHPLGRTVGSDCARWIDWHKGIENAPEPPSDEMIERQRKHLAPNILCRNEYTPEAVSA